MNWIHRAQGALRHHEGHQHQLMQRRRPGRGGEQGTKHVRKRGANRASQL